MSALIDLIKDAEARGLVVTGITFGVGPSITAPPSISPVITNHAPQAPHAAASLGSFVCTIGKKFKDQRLDQISAFELNNYVQYLVKSASETRKPLKGAFLEFVETAEAYLKTIERPRR